MAAVLAAAVPLGMANLAVILCVQEWTDSIRTAGMLAGLFGFCNAVGLLVQGRLIDRLNPRRVVAPAGVVSTASWLGCVWVGNGGGPIVLVAVLLAVAGVTVPAVTAAVRAWLAGAVDDPSSRVAAYALLSVLFQIAVTVGPLLVGVSLLLGGAPLALVVVAGLTALAVGIFVGGPRREVSRPKKASAAGLNRQMVPLLMSAALVGLAMGVTAVALPGITAEAGAPAVAGALFAAAAAGEVLGAFLYGGRRWQRDRWRQLGCVLAAAAAVAVVVAAVAVLAVVEVWALAPVMLIVGVVGAPVSIVMSALLDDLVPKAALGSAYSLLPWPGSWFLSWWPPVWSRGRLAMGVRGLLMLPPAALAAAVLVVAARWWLVRRTQSSETHGGHDGQPSGRERSLLVDR